MKFQVSLKPRAEKGLGKLPKNYKEKILTALLILSENPYAGKKLEGEYKDCYSLRIWPYRIIYQVYQKKLLIIVIAIGHRQGSYK